MQPPCVDTILDVTKHTFTRDDLFRMERKIFEALQFDISFPTRYDFVLFLAQIAQLSDKQYQLYLYLIMLSYTDYNLHYFKSSQVAAAALHLTLQVTQTILNLSLRKTDLNPRCVWCLDYQAVFRVSTDLDVDIAALFALPRDRIDGYYLAIASSTLECDLQTLLGVECRGIFLYRRADAGDGLLCLVVSILVVHSRPTICTLRAAEARGRLDID